MKKILFIILYFILIDCCWQSFAQQVTGPGIYELVSYGNGFHSNDDGASLNTTRERKCEKTAWTLWVNNDAVYHRYVADFGNGHVYSGKLINGQDVLIEHYHEKPYLYSGEYVEVFDIYDRVTYSNRRGERGEAELFYSPGRAPKLIPDQEMFQCNINENGISHFNLEEIYDKIIDKNDPDFYGDDYYDISFYESIDAINNNNPIATPTAYEYNTFDPKELFIKVHVKDHPFKCFSIMNFAVSAVETTLGDIDPMLICYSNNNNYGFFDLVAKENEIRAQFALSETTLIDFYRTEADAELKKNVIVNDQYNSKSGTLWVRLENEKSECIAIEPITLIVNSFPETILKDEYPLCLNKLPEDTLEIDAGLNYEAYQWKDENDVLLSTTSSVSISKLGNYTLTVHLTENGLQCAHTEEFSVVASNTATIEFIESQNNTIIVRTTGEGTYNYQIVDGNNLVYRPYQGSHTFEDVAPGIYTVNVKDIKNDCGVVNDKTSIIGFPKFFTPNNDGINDTWQVIGVNDMFHQNSKILIYDRFGKLLKSVNPFGKGWDGTANGKKLAADDYWFTITLKSGQTFKGHFSLKR